jgi:hypothetical protein
MQVARVKLGDLCETLEVEHSQRATFPLHSARLPQQLERTVHVDRRDSQGITDELLRDRKA